MAEARASVSERRRISPIWFVPIVALVLGVYMVIHTLQSQGPEIIVEFETAAGITAGKTKIRVRNVEVGLVESVRLGDDLERVILTARLDPEATPLLRADTQFWVVRPRIGAAGISGIGTLLSGAYVQLLPGTGPEGRRDFVGREEPPVTPTGTPGLRIRLERRTAGSLSTGDPILYKGYRVGRIEETSFDVESRRMLYGGFIDAPYDDLVNSATRFWDASGISLSATADGIELKTGSLQTLLVGGITFGLPEGVGPGSPVEDDASFKLYDDFKAVNERPFRHSIEYVVSFEQSVRGLRPGAPVEYRGIPIGQVERVLWAEMAKDMRGTGDAIEVLIRIEPGRLELPDTLASVERMEKVISNSVAIGLRASLATGNLLTGSRYIALDIHPDEPGAIGTYAGRPTIPSIPGGLEGVQQKLFALLDKLNALPLEDLTASAAGAIANLKTVLESESMQELPLSLDRTLADLQRALDTVSPNSALHEHLLRTLTELNRTLASLRRLLATLDDKPNSVIFSREPPSDPEPAAGKP
jgi:paraquat-inducible protein B